MKYWSLKLARDLYGIILKEIERNCYDFGVADFWLAIMCWRFPAIDKYMYSFYWKDVQIADSSNTSVYKLQYLQIHRNNGKSAMDTILIVIENKTTPRSEDSDVWASTAAELLRYLDAEHLSGKFYPGDPVGLVIIGRYVRFYIRGKEGGLEDYPGTNGKAFEIKEDRMEIREILDRIKEVVVDEK